MRPSPETQKEFGTILVPVFVDDNKDIDKKILETTSK